jgi:hypothetical protein
MKRRKLVRCLDCLRHNDDALICRKGDKPVVFDTNRIARASRHCSAFKPVCTFVESGNVLIHVAPVELFDGREWHTAPRRVESPHKVH